jgi:hypothetical protein
MKRGLVTKAFAAWACLRRELWTMQMLSCRCISILPSGQIILKDAFLGSAEELRLELLIGTPCLRRRLRQSLGIRIARYPGTGFLCDGEALSDVQVRQLRRGVTKVRAALPRSSWANCDSLHFEIHQARSQRPLARIPIRVLDTIAFQKRVLASVKATRLRLWSHNRTGFQAAHAVAGASGSLVPELTLPASQFSRLIPAFDALLTIELISPAGHFVLHRQHIQIGADILRFRGPAVRLHGNQLFAQPGNYALVARIGERQIARYPFRVLSDADLLRQIEVARVQIHAQTRTGDSVPGVTTLLWEEHKGFQAYIEFRTQTIAPDTLVPCIACIRDGTTVLQREDFVFPLDRISRTVKLRPLEFGGPGLQTQPKPARLSVSISIDGVERACALVLVLPPERITNFEGQLTFEVDDLPFDELEYGQIVHRLGLQTQTNSRRGFWHWLQSNLS